MRNVAAVAGLAAGILLSPQATLAGEAEHAPRVAPSPLLAVDQNRASIVEGIVGTWRDGLAAAFAESSPEREARLREALMGLRADRLLSASLAGTLDGLARALAEPPSEPLTRTPGGLLLKALGDTTQDLAYTPVTPCRIVDTRGGAGGTLVAGATRHWLAANPSGTFTGQGGAASNCSIAVKPAAVLINVTVAGTAVGPAFLAAWPFNQTRPNAATLNWNSTGQQVANAVIVPLCTGAGCTADFSVYVSAQTEVIVDVMGFFKAPGGTIGDITGITAGAGLTGSSASGEATLAIASGGVTNAMLANASVNVAKLDTASTDARYFRQNGNAFGATAVLGTTDANALEVRVANARAMRYEPNSISPNVIGGHPTNSAGVGVRGASIAGGGVAAGDSDPDFSGEAANTVTDHYGTVGGGYGNQAGDAAGTTADTPFATVGGGRINTASGLYSTVGGGTFNAASGTRSTVVGGSANVASGIFDTVAGGNSNVASGTFGFIGGGEFNDASSSFSTVAGGGNNTASGSHGTVAGGNSNTASGNFSFAAGGSSNVASGNYSLAAGRKARTQTSGGTVHDGTFVWADSSNFNFYSTATNQFSARATGGVRFVLAIDGAGNPTWTCQASNGGSWSCSSDRDLKENFARVDGRSMLARLSAMPLYFWNAKGTNPQVRHVGPTAQDFKAAFGVGDNDRMIGFQDADGVALAAIQGLHELVREKDREIAAQKREVGDQKQRLVQLERKASALDRVQRELAELKARLDARLGSTMPGR